MSENRATGPRTGAGAIIARIAAAGLRHRPAVNGRKPDGPGDGTSPEQNTSHTEATDGKAITAMEEPSKDVVNAAASSGADGFNEELGAEAEAVGTTDRSGRNVDIDVTRGHEYDAAVSADDWGAIRTILSRKSGDDSWRGQAYSDCCAAFIRRFGLEQAPASLLRRAQRRVDRRTPMSAVLGAYAEYSYLADAIAYGRTTAD